MIETLKEIGLVILIISIGFPPFGIALMAVVLWAIGELLGISDTGGSDYSSGEPDYRGDEAMNYLASNDPKGYRKLTDKHPDLKTDYGERKARK